MSAKTIDMPDVSTDQRIAPASPMELLVAALRKADPAQLAQLLDVQIRYEANEARKAYVAALQAFKANPPDINKDKLVSYPNKDGSTTSYRHAALDVANDIIQPALKVHGLCATWKPSDSNGRIVVTCVLTHSQGHAEEIATLSGPADTSGGKNNIQAIGSTTTYLQRYTLLSGLGLVAHGQDDDGKTEGMDSNAVEDYCIQMRDASAIPELQKVFKECYQKSKAINDKTAQAAFVKVYEQRKRDLQ